MTEAGEHTRGRTAQCLQTEIAMNVQRSTHSAQTLNAANTETHSANPVLGGKQTMGCCSEALVGVAMKAVCFFVFIFVVVLFVSAGKVFYCQASFSIHEATNQSICSFAHKHCSAQPFRRLCVFIFIFFTAHIRNGCVFSCSPWPRQLSVQMQTMLCLDKFTAIRFRISQENKCVVYIENESRE